MVSWPTRAGTGDPRGSLSLNRRFRINQPGRVMLRTPRSNAAGAGREGGQAGAAFSARLIRDGVETDLPRQMEIVIQVQPGDIVDYTGPGGGGYGNPFRRDPELVLADVRDEKIALHTAQSQYGVVIDPDTLAIDGTKSDPARGAEAPKSLR